MPGLIPQTFINDLVARVDIVPLIGERVKLKKAGKNYQGLCPFHDEKSPSFSVSPDKQFYHCFGCGESGTALKFLMEYDRLEFVPAVEALAAMVGVSVPREGGARPTKRVGTELYDVLERAATVFRRQLKGAPEAIEYLKGRSLSGVTARDFGLGFAPEAWDTMMKSLGPGSSSGSRSGTNEIRESSENELLRAGLLTQNDRGRQRSWIIPASGFAHHQSCASRWAKRLVLGRQPASGLALLQAPVILQLLGRQCSLTVCRAHFT